MAELDKTNPIKNNQSEPSSQKTKTSPKKHGWTFAEAIPTIKMSCLFVVSQSIAIGLSYIFKAKHMEAFEDPESMSNILLFGAIILIFTLILLMIIKYGKKRIIQLIILASICATLFYVFYPFLEFVFLPEIATIIAVVLSVFLVWRLYKHPEWYVVDGVGIIVAAGAAAIFGISLAILPVIILLVALAIYDAISVYRTKHMITLADSVTDLRLPVLVVIPKTKGYSFLKQKSLKKEIDEGEEREAMFLGLGDIVIPCILAVSALTFLEPGRLIFGLSRNLIVAISTMVCSLIALLILSTLVGKGKAHAGLPFLNTGAIIGYLISTYILYRNFGISL
jgi:presenilin-like A22 family membrane protease